MRPNNFHPQGSYSKQPWAYQRTFELWTNNQTDRLVEIVHNWDGLGGDEVFKVAAQSLKAEFAHEHFIQDHLSCRARYYHPDVKGTAWKDKHKDLLVHLRDSPSIPPSWEVIADRLQQHFPDFYRHPENCASMYSRIRREREQRNTTSELDFQRQTATQRPSQPLAESQLQSFQTSTPAFPIADQDMGVYAYSQPPKPPTRPLASYNPGAGSTAQPNMGVHAHLQPSEQTTGNTISIFHACVFVEGGDIQNCKFYDHFPPPQSAPVLPEGAVARFPAAHMRALQLELYNQLCGHWVIPPVMDPQDQTSDGFITVFTFMSFQFSIRPSATDNWTPLRYVICV